MSISVRRAAAKTFPVLVILLAIGSAPALAEDSPTRPTTNAGESAAPKIRVILPAPWEPTPAQAGATVDAPRQRSASR
jgi:hypothetical protein